MKPFRLKEKNITEYMATEGMQKKSFSLKSQGKYEPEDADWNYKDIPHLKMVHKNINNHLVVGEDDFLASIAFQKILWKFKIPLCLMNYDYDKTTQIYYTSFLWYLLLIETKITKEDTNYTTVETTYNIYGGVSLTFFYFAIKYILTRNYKMLMVDDIPMRLRKGWLRDSGYSFIKDNQEGKYSYLETTKISEIRVIDQKKFQRHFHYTLSLNDYPEDFNTCLGKSDSSGFRVVKSGDSIFIYPRMCNHEGADLSCADTKNNFLVCPWHGKRVDPICMMNKYESSEYIDKEKYISFNNNEISIKST
jgi:nitrite reductase/ring-hydroxylating ferredoxin subunit